MLKEQKRPVLIGVSVDPEVVKLPLVTPFSIG